MLIQEMTKQVSLNLLARMHLGRLARIQGDQPYVVPFYFAYNNNSIYSFTTVGKKIEWIRANPLVCVEADEVKSPGEWVSVIISGSYQELCDTAEYQSERALAHNLLPQKAVWWKPGYAKTILHDAECPLVPVYFVIRVDQITGHRASP